MPTTPPFGSSNRWGPESTPHPIARLIFITIVSCLAVSLVNNWIQSLFGVPGPESIFSFSYWGISHYMLWQPLTYLFVFKTGSGISFNFLVNLTVEMYILWMMGTMVLERIGTKPFFQLYFLTGVGSALVTLLPMALFQPFAFISGPTAAILAVFTVWTMLYPEMVLLLFFILPVKAKWLYAGALGALCLIDLSQGSLLDLFHKFSAVFLAYSCAVIYWNLTTPFSFLIPFERQLCRLSMAFSRRFKRNAPKEAPSKKKTTIIDITTGAPVLDDDAFIDAMLSKISHSGENSLSWSERQRMNEIAEKKRRKR